MNTRQRNIARVVRILITAAAIVVAIAIIRIRNMHKTLVHYVQPAATRPAAPIATQPAESIPKPPPEPPVARTYLDVIRAAYPQFPATQPLGMPLDLSQAAHLIIDDPVYLSMPPHSDLWITRTDAPSTAQALQEAIDPKLDAQVHVTRERVVFVHWMPTDGGTSLPWLICRTSDGGFEVVNASGRFPLPRRDYRWESAMSWNEKLVVPCTTGVSILQLWPRIIDSYHELAPPDADPARLAAPQILLDWKGLLAWLPWEEQKIGGRGAARYVDGAWIDLGADRGFPEKILHLVPLNDGNVLMLHANDETGVQLSMAVLDRLDVDEKKIAELVAALADPEESKRQDAYKKLTTYGSGIWPILEKMLDDQEPEAKARLRLLLRDKVEPTLGGMKLIGSKKLRLAARLSDGGTVFYADAGVSISNPDRPDDDPTIIVPAWISIRPGAPIELLPPPMVADLTPGKSKIDAIGSDWLVTTDIRGPRRFIGNGLVQMLRKNESGFSELIGEDRRGRWLFRKPPVSAATQPATEPATQDTSSPDATLIIDPTLPNPKPRLPVWVFRTAKIVGWDKNDWPVAKNESSYALHEAGWELVDEKDPVYTKPDEISGSPTTRQATTGPSTEPSTLPALGPATQQTATAPAQSPEPSTLPVLGPVTQQATTLPSIEPATIASTVPATQPDEPPRPILVLQDGTRYYDGLTELRVVSPTGDQTIWPLPAIANGQGPVTLLRTKDGRLFLFNQRGRVLRIKPTPDAAEPFELEATFTHNIPTIDQPTRIWLDPADRIIIAWGSQLAILFPSGYIPPAIVEKMLGQPDVGEE